jgi:hypothetical protein
MADGARMHPHTLARIFEEVFKKENDRERVRAVCAREGSVISLHGSLSSR